MNAGPDNALDAVLGPIRHLIPGFVVLLLIALLSVIAGMYNVFALPNEGDRAILFLLALTVYPGPYLLYTLFCVFLFHRYRLRRITQIFYLSCALLAVAPFAAAFRHLEQTKLPLPQRLDLALFDNFLAAVAIGAISLALMAAVGRAAQWAQDDSD